jgi:DNA-binding PadR family transcriptional regulator
MRQRYSLDVAILLLLVAMPTTSSDLEQPLATFGYMWSTPGMVGQHLRQLAQDGLVARTWDTSGNDRPRLIYSITEAGLAYLRRVGIPRGC